MITYRPTWLDEGENLSMLDYLVDGVSFLELVRSAELPDARAEAKANTVESGMCPAPLLAGTYVHAWGLSAEHLLGGEPDEVPHGAEEGESMLLACACDCFGCWALMARIIVGEDTVTWSNLRNTRRDWNYDLLGNLTFPRRQYESSLHAALPSPRDRVVRRGCALPPGR